MLGNTYLNHSFIAPEVPPSCSIRFISPAKGRGLFAEKDMIVGEVIFTEKPFCSMQHVENRELARTCGNCFAFLGTLEMQLAHLQTYCGLIQMDSFMQLPKDPNDTRFHIKAGIVDCSYGCGEKYCCEECRQQAYIQHHQLLCVGPITDRNHPLFQFKQYAIANNELFLHAAQVICRIICFWQLTGTTEGTDIMSMFHHRAYLDIVNLEQVGMKKSQVQKMMEKSLEYLREAFLYPIVKENPTAPIQNLFTFEYYSHLLGLLETNDNAINIDSPLHIYQSQLNKLPEYQSQFAMKLIQPVLKELQHFQDSGDKEMEDDDEDEGKGADEMQGVDEAQEEKHDESLIPGFAGFGLYPLETMINHSCEPNCTIKFDKDYTAFVVATKPIQKGEEISHSYIENDQPLDGRQYDLQEYGFVCDCERCQRESGN